LPKKSTYYSVVGTMVEVEVALEKWKSLNKPKNMVVDIALGLSTNVESNIQFWMDSCVVA
jgi:hypothetical protein